MGDRPGLTFPGRDAGNESMAGCKSIKDMPEDLRNRDRSTYLLAPDSGINPSEPTVSPVLTSAGAGTMAGVGRSADRAVQQLPETREVAERNPVGVAPQQADVRVGIDREELFEDVAGRVGLAHPRIDPRERLQERGTIDGVRRDRNDVGRQAGLPDRLVLPPEAGEGQTLGRPPPGVPWAFRDRLLQDLPPRLAERLRPRAVVHVQVDEPGEQRLRHVGILDV